MPGLQVPYEPSDRPEVTVRGDQDSPEGAAARVVAAREERGYLSGRFGDVLAYRTIISPGGDHGDRAMIPPMERSADWMDQAQGDLAHARNDREDGFFDWACFSAQQAAEKAVKAVFQVLGQEAWGHSVADFLQELPNTQSLPDGLIDMALELDKAYIPTRCPNAHPSGSPRTRYTRAEATRLIQYAEQILRTCEDLLSAA